MKRHCCLVITTIEGERHGKVSDRLALISRRAWSKYGWRRWAVGR